MENMAQVPSSTSAQVVTANSSPRSHKIFIFLGIFLFILLLIIGGGVVYIMTLKKNNSSPSIINTSSLSPTAVPTPTTLLKEEYKNPFEEKNQYQNPFETSENPFDALSQ
ncbi:MAG: hypothetical protein HYW86_00755 [Candidatus Roizmanbacteria bacterium]|nr:MAG: hypothetical protein HYW86_00755 [Candidatus Roizmanbacteria bacterium]